MLLSERLVDLYYKSRAHNLIVKLRGCKLI